MTSTTFLLHFYSGRGCSHCSSSSSSSTNSSGGGIHCVSNRNPITTATVPGTGSIGALGGGGDGSGVIVVVV